MSVGIGKEQWSSSALNGQLRSIVAVPAGTSRLQLMAFFEGPGEGCAPWLDLPPAPGRKRSASECRGDWFVVEDLPADAPSQIGVITERAPAYLICQAIKASPAGVSGSGLFPRGLGPPRERPERPDLNVAEAVENLERGDVDRALAFAGKLCLSGRTDLLAEFMRSLTPYLAARPLLRNDQFGFFVAAVSGARGDL